MGGKKRRRRGWRGTEPPEKWAAERQIGGGGVNEYSRLGTRSGGRALKTIEIIERYLS